MRAVLRRALLAAVTFGPLSVVQQAYAADTLPTGVPVEDVVNLILLASPGGPCPPSQQNPDVVFHELLSDGSVASSAFEVPNGHVLAVTDIAWQSRGPHVAGRSVSFHLRMLVNPGQTRSVYQSASVPITSSFSNARIGTHESLVTPILVGPDAVLCPTANEHAGNTFVFKNLANVSMQGYLIKAKAP